MMHRLFCFLFAIFFLIGCSDRAEQNTPPVPLTPQEQILKFSVEESPYAFMVESHIRQYDHFFNKDLTFTDCYTLGKLIGFFKLHIMNADEVDFDNPKAIAYLKELNNTETESGKNIEKAYHLLFQDSCPIFDYAGVRDDFLITLQDHLMYLEKMKLAALYGYIKEKSVTNYIFDIDAFFYLNTTDTSFSIARRNASYIHLPSSLANNNQFAYAEYLFKLGWSYEFSKSLFNRMQRNEVYDLYKEEILSVFSLIEAINATKKENISDLKYLDSKVENLVNLAEEYSIKVSTQEL